MLRRFSIVLITGVALLGGNLRAEETLLLPPGVTKLTTVEGITEYNLPNGLRVLFAPDDSKPTTTVNTTYLVGSRNENYGETGMAHLLEHLMFKGTPTYRRPLADMTKRGLRANGTTWVDRTNYFASFAASDENLEWYLRWSADAMTHSFIARTDLDSEMTVVRNEMERGENDPFSVLLEKMQAVAYQWHSYGKSTIGARADVENVNIERLQAFYHKYYQPDNAVLIVTGKFNQIKTLALIADTFGKIPRPARILSPTYTLDPAQEGERSIVLRRVGDTQLVAALYHIPPGSSPDYAAVEALAQILGDTPSGRLHKTLVETKQAASVYGFSYGFKEPGVAVFGAQLPNDASLEVAKAMLLKTVEGVAAQPITAEELDRARTKLLKNFDLTTADPERIGVGLSSAIAMGDWRLYFLDRDHIRNLTVNDVQRVATQYLQADNRTLGMFVPTAQPQRPPAPAFVDVVPLVKDYKGDPAVIAGEAFDAIPENIDARTQRGRLSVGLKFAILSKRTRARSVHAILRLHFGDERSLFGVSPAGSVVGAMLARGASGMTREQIQDAFDKLKARVSFGGDEAGATVSIETTRDSFPAVLKLVAQILRHPDFSAEEFDRLKNEWITEYEGQRLEPSSIARIALSRHGNPYPRGDVRYEETLEEDITDLKALPLAKVKAFYADFYGAGNGEIAVVGDCDAQSTRSLLEDLFAGWKSAKPYTRVSYPPYEAAPVQLKFEAPDKANAVFNTQLRFALRDTDEDYPALLVANQIFGGGPSSRLWTRIRDKDGLSYGVGSGASVSAFESSASWAAGGIYAPQNLDRFIQAFNEELLRVLKDGFSADELKDAKNALLQSRRLSRAQDGALSGALAGQLELDRTTAFAAEIDRKIQAVTLEEANAVLRKYVDPAKLVSVVAGDFAKK